MINRINRWITQKAEKAEADRMNDHIYALLRREVTRVGLLHEEKPYKQLMGSDEEMSFTESAEGVEISFSCCCVDVKRNGDILYCIDASTKPNNTGRQPSYKFCKSVNGEIYY